MRSIEFRIWLNGSFHYWGFVELRAGKVFVGLPTNNQDRLSMDEAEIRSQQFTGLLDKNGKKIWEGDIVHCTLRAMGEEIYAVEWIEVTAEFSIQNKVICEKYLEVIGNIYEHSHLLENKNAKRD